MKFALRVAATTALLATSSWAVSTVNSSKSNVIRVLQRGRFITATANMQGGTRQIVYTTPTTGDFILTQVCGAVSSNVDAGILFQIGGVSLAQMGLSGCQAFNPGMVLPPDQALTCYDLSSGFCTITGILGPPNPTPVPQP